MSHPIQHRNTALILLGLLIYALIYTGLHQYSNPARVVQDCDLVDHHFHQNPDKHACQLCDYHLKLELTANQPRFTELLVHRPEPVKQLADPCLNQYYLPSLRAPPNS